MNFGRIERQTHDPANENTRHHDSSMSVALVTETYPPEINGVAHTLHHIVQGLLARGHRVHLVRPHQGADDVLSPPHARLTERRVAGLPIMGYKGLHLGLPARGLLLRCWRRQTPDAVYIATEGPLGASALSAARRLDIPVLSGFHTNFHSYSRYYRMGLLEPLIQRYLRRFHNRTDCTLVPTEALRRDLAARGFDNCEVLARGVDTTLFHPQRRDPALREAWGVGDDETVVLYVGRLAAEKNLGLAVEGFRAMQTRNPKLRFVLVGDGPATAELKRLNPDFVFCGMRTGEDLARHYASGDVFLFPSTSETFGNVVIEAMASGLAIVAYDYAAAREHLRHEQSALLAPFDDAGRFVALAREMATSPELIARLRHAARNDALPLDWQRIHARLEDLFEAHLKKRGERHAPAAATHE